MNFYSLRYTKIFAALVLTILLCQASIAQTKKSRLLFIVDASSSMSYKWDGNDNRFDAARKVILAIMDSMYAVNNEVEFAVRVYGSQSPAQNKNCFDTKLEVDFGLQNGNQINTRLKYLKPMGSSPIAFSLQEAADNELSNTNLYDYSFILVSDGGESCNGDICDAFKKLVANKIKVTPYIIGLDTNQSLLRYYECLGKYVSVTNPKEIAKAVSLVLENNRTLLAKKTTLGLKTTYSDVGKLETPAFQGNAIDINYLTPINKVLKYTSLIRMPRAYIIRPRNTKPVDQLVSVEAKPFITGLTSIATIPARRLSFSFLRPLPTLKYKLQPTLNLSTLIEVSAKPSIAIDALVSVSGKITPRKLKEPVLPKVKKLAAWQMPSFDISRTALDINSIASVPRRLQITIKESKPTLPKQKALAPIVIPQFELSKAPIEIGKLSFKAPMIALVREEKKPTLPAKKKLLPLSLPEFDLTKSAITISSLNFITANYTFQRSNARGPIPNIRKVGKVQIPELEPTRILDPINIATIFYNQFRMGYTPSRPTPRKAVVATKRKLFIPNYTVAVKPTITNEEPEYKIETVESGETRIQVYFTDGKGKFYKTKPDIIMMDAVTKATKKTFIRTVTNGEPDAIKLDIDGQFDISVVGKKDIILHNVNIPKNKTTKVFLKVESGTLVFKYTNNRNRPVEFNALVFVRNKSKAPTPIKCDEQRMFDPGDYHIEIDVLPKYAVTTEISFGAETEIQIPQLGQVNILNMENIGEVLLYAERSDHFEYFYTTKVDGNLPKQKLQLRPGVYQASWIPPNSPQGTTPKVMKFLIKSNMITDVELRDIGNNVVTPEGTGRLLYTEMQSPELNIQLDKK